MHRNHPIAVLLHQFLYPNPRPSDPSSFSAHLAKNLVPEVRIETATFYGSLDTIEARYPGLNYSHPPHRKRLGRFPHHAALFKAFDALELTEGEIAGFCRWEGTKWARERYERDEGIKVQDTTGLDIPEWVDPRKTKKARLDTTPRASSGNDGIHIKREMTVEIEQVGRTTVDTEMPDVEDSEVDEEEGELEDAAEETIGAPSHESQFRVTSMPNQHERTLQPNIFRAASNAMQTPAGGMDLAVWEQWIKEATENGNISQLSAAEYAQQHGFLPSTLTSTASTQFPSPTNPRMGSPRA
ncbi:hypothetical protein EV356DRAFT_498903 [Viridothelium virens]|uniref:Uncharacterized protein n=1 Tax=Viridothelium virens TaxID=1048519 RepID=A0A6A6HDE6_VIRVR|nr:hypothetical protein EV356DRAFT_498903 [Viridothelium virens]